MGNKSYTKKVVDLYRPDFEELTASIRLSLLNECRREIKAVMKKCGQCAPLGLPCAVHHDWMNGAATVFRAVMRTHVPITSELYQNILVNMVDTAVNESNKKGSKRSNKKGSKRG
jgi:hypothetical protein